MIEISDAGGATRIERRFGFASVNITPSQQAVMGRFTTVGVFNSPLGTEIGFSSQALAVLPDDCHLVLWIENREQVWELQHLLQGKGDICVLNR